MLIFPGERMNSGLTLRRSPISDSRTMATNAPVALTERTAVNTTAIKPTFGPADIKGSHGRLGSLSNHILARSHVDREIIASLFRRQLIPNSIQECLNTAIQRCPPTP
jgi:hypothetical protein